MGGFNPHSVSVFSASGEDTDAQLTLKSHKCGRHCRDLTSLDLIFHVALFRAILALQCVRNHDEPRNDVVLWNSRHRLA